MPGKPVNDLRGMLAGMEPALDERAWQFAADASVDRTSEAFALIRETEGTTLVLPADTKRASPTFARITLQVYSDLEGVGLTAAVSTALANVGIACNVIAAFHHDHIFVPWDRRQEAMDLLITLSCEASGRG
ncbi:ACT domain-containing protein [uncultured Erythrobacter sp.]|uniref:ACT domain-containing protein n=1 Tax=uncultured Erythrobacter sp. TaxID=263913 RepID=UPI00261E3DC8|nr:ACT domain-containing protein [uncultured Erythrobacter sp.]